MADESVSGLRNPVSWKGDMNDTVANRKLYTHPAGAVGADGTKANGDAEPTAEDDGWSIARANAIAVMVNTDEKASGVSPAAGAGTDIEVWGRSWVDGGWRVIHEETDIVGQNVSGTVWLGDAIVIETAGLFDRAFVQVTGKADNDHTVDVYGIKGAF